ncbi:DUF115 domain-containing protein [bacterium]|nr:DUF115 domain-containing protein [bacterium]MBU1433510.1 DUF115 domain-containing protein [bacterium]MBU1503308.1 DUF115 domain-containing protein [bacterium]
MSFFQINLSAITAKNLNFANQLSDVGEVADFEIFMDENDVSTLNFVNTKNFTPLYENTPAQSIVNGAEYFKMFEQYPYLYMYGLGNGMLLKHLLENKNLKRIVVVEPEMELAYVVLHMVDFSQELESGRVVLLSATDVNFPNILTLFKTLDEQRYVRVYDMHVNTSYYEKIHHEHIQRTNQMFLEALYHAINSVGNDTTDALIGLKQHIANLPVLLETPPLLELLNKLNTTDTAILVSTGPSLTKQLPLLKEIAPYVRIIAVDASFPVLYQAGIKPDVVVSMERVKESARFFQQVPREAYEDVVTVLSSLQHQDVVKSPKGGTTTMSLRPLGYMIATGPKEWGYLGIGTSAANMAFELIYYSKFKNCILIGQDLAYAEDGTSHAKGHVFGENDVKVKESDVWVKGWGGTTVRTNHNWTMFRNFFEKDLADIKDDMLTINATQGGASILGAKEIAFSEAINLCVNKNSVKKPLRLEKMQKKELDFCKNRTWKNIDDIVLYVSDLLEEVKTLFLDIAATCDALDAAREVTNSRMQELLQHVEQIKARKDEEIYEQVVWHIAQSMMLVQEMDLAPTEVYKAKNEEENEEKMRILLRSYKAWLFSFAGIMDAILKTIIYARARTLINEVSKIDVYLENEKIDTIVCENFTATNGRVFDVDVRGILYDVPDAFQDKIDTISFRDAKSQTELPAAFVSVFSRDDEKYNELSFVRSLEEPVDEEKIKDLYCKNSIGFLAIKENLEDEDFMAYVKELRERFPDITFKAFYFNSEQKNKVMENLKNYQIDYIGIKDIYELAESVEVWISNSKSTFKVKRIYEVFLCQNPNIFTLNYTHNDLSLLEFEEKFKSHYRNLFEISNLKKLESENMQDLNGQLCDLLDKKYSILTNFNMNSNLKEYWAVLIKTALDSSEFKNFYTEVFKIIRNNK